MAHLATTLRYKTEGRGIDSLNLLEPHGSVQACYGIALPLLLPFTGGWVEVVRLIWRREKYITCFGIRNPDFPVRSRVTTPIRYPSFFFREGLRKTTKTYFNRICFGNRRRI